MNTETESEYKVMMAHAEFIITTAEQELGELHRRMRDLEGIIKEMKKLRSEIIRKGFGFGSA